MSTYQDTKKRRSAWRALREAEALARAAGLNYLIPMHEPGLATKFRLSDVQACADKLRKAVEAKRVVVQS